jgi:hypothetical protein
MTQTLPGWTPASKNRCQGEPVKPSVTEGFPKNRGVSRSGPQGVSEDTRCTLPGRCLRKAIRKREAAAHDPRCAVRTFTPPLQPS